MATETNSPTTNSNQNNSSAATLKKGAIDWSNIFVLAFCTAAASVVVSTYVLGLAWLGSKDNAADPLDRAARAAADDLLRINVVSASFGPVGIADFYNDDPLNEGLNHGTAGGIASGASGYVRSYNTVATQLRSALFLAQKHNLSAMSAAAGADFKELNGLRGELRQKIISSVYANGTGKIYEHVKRILMSSRRGGEKLLSLKIQVGIAKDAAPLTEIEAQPEDLQAENSVLKTGGGKLKALVDLYNPDEKDKPVEKDKPDRSIAAFTLHQQPRGPLLVDADKFTDVYQKTANLPDRVLPTAILIDCQFSKANADGGKERRTICILPGADIKKQSSNERLIGANSAGCFAVSFPQGRPQNFDSLLAILEYKSWQKRMSQHGIWQQAVDGGVPGTGNLTPPAQTYSAVDPSEALSIAFYHWLRTQPKPLSPAKIEQTLALKWQNTATTARGEKQSKPSRLTEDGEGEIDAQDNSALLRESGARLFALTNLSKPAEAGQKALFNCFQANSIKYPPSSLPLVIDSSGQPNLPGHSGFDRALALSLLSDLYFTNVAAQDSLATARLIEINSMRAYKLSKERSFLAQTELDSLSNRQKSETDQKLKTMLGQEVEYRNSRITAESSEQKKQLRAYTLAQQAMANARAIASQSFECGAKLNQLTRAGINRLDQPDENGNGGYVLGKRFIFRPLNQALQETEITATAGRLADLSIDTTGGGAGVARANSQESTKENINQNSKDFIISPWLRKNMRVFGKIKTMTSLADTALMVEGKSLSELLAAGPPVKKAEALTVVFSPALLHNQINLAKQTAVQEQLLYFSEYPFKGLGIPERQLVYYGQNAYQSASLPTGTVNWSVLARDLVANKGLNSNHQKLGQPQTPISTGWYKKADNWQTDKEENFGAIRDCGGLACEWQLRSPAMLLNVDDSDQASSDPLKGTTLSDPESGQRVPQIPPVNPDLL